MSKSKSNQFGSDAGEEPITDATVYQAAFEKIEQAIFVRVAMDTPAAPAAPLVVQTPAVPVLPAAAKPPQASVASLQ